jgi:hypothetical protein
MDDSDSDIRRCGQSLVRASVGTRISSRVGAVLKRRMAYAKGTMVVSGQNPRIWPNSEYQVWRRFWGRVVRVSQLGPKNVRTDEPMEKVDTKILETLARTRRRYSITRRPAGGRLRRSRRRRSGTGPARTLLNIAS